MKTWKEADITILDFTETAGLGNDGTGHGGNGNGKKDNNTWTEAQKNGNTTFVSGIANPVDDGYNGVVEYPSNC